MRLNPSIVRESLDAAFAGAMALGRLGHGKHCHRRGLHFYVRIAGFANSGRLRAVIRVHC